jgi:hypothetical protein
MLQNRTEIRRQNRAALMRKPDTWGVLEMKMDLQ